MDFVMAIDILAMLNKFRIDWLMIGLMHFIKPVTTTLVH